MVDFDASVLSGEFPVNGRTGLVSFCLQGRDFATEGLFSGDTPMQDSPGQDPGLPFHQLATLAGELEINLPGVVYYHPVDTPPPAMMGKLPVPTKEITWDGSSWSVASHRLVTTGAMHLANELNWLGRHLGSIPFPAVGN